MDDVLQNASTLLGRALGYIETKKENRLIGISSGFYNIDNITDGFQNGEVTVIKDEGEGTSAFLFTLLKNLALDKNIKCFVYSDKYSEVFVGINLLRMAIDFNHHYLISAYNIPDDNEKIKKAYEKLQELPVWAQRFYEYDIEQNCSDIRDFMGTYGGNLADYDRIIFINSISYENLKPIKELAEELNVPIVVFQRNESRDSNYSDCEIKLSRMNTGGNRNCEIPYRIKIKNKTTLIEGECNLGLNLNNGYFETE